MPFRCDKCCRIFDFISFIGGVALCRECVKPYDAELLHCLTHREYHDFIGRLRAEILGFRDRPQ